MIGVLFSIGSVVFWSCELLFKYHTGFDQLK